MKTIVLRAKDINKGDLILVNQACRYRAQQIDLSPIGVWEGTDILYESTAACALAKLMAKIGGAGQIVPVSAWRSMEEQQDIWDDSLAQNGLEFTRKFVAVPGHSEHQTGLAVDLALRQPQIDFIRPNFPYEGVCQRFRERAAEYGFVERYMETKQAVTQIGHEPWHFRYVGLPHAMIMARLGLALEEYTAFVKDYRYGENPYLFQAENGVAYAVSYLEAAGKGNTRGENHATMPEAAVKGSAQADNRATMPEAAVKGSAQTENRTTTLVLDDARPYSISGNNCDGFILTQICG